MSAKYLATLNAALSGSEPSLLLDVVRTRWRTAKPADVAAIVADIGQWQKALWKFNSVGHIGNAGGPEAWMEPVTPLAAKQEIRFKIPPSAEGKEVVLYLATSDAGDGNEGDFAVWEKPRLVAPGRSDLLLRDVRTASVRRRGTAGTRILEHREMPCRRSRSSSRAGPDLTRRNSRGSTASNPSF